MGWNKNAAVDDLVKHAGLKSTGYCATFTRRAIEAATPLM